MEDINIQVPSGDWIIVSKTVDGYAAYRSKQVIQTSDNIVTLLKKITPPGYSLVMRVRKVQPSVTVDFIAH